MVNDLCKQYADKFDLERAKDIFAERTTLISSSTFQEQSDNHDQDRKRKLCRPVIKKEAKRIKDEKFANRVDRRNYVESFQTSAHDTSVSTSSFQKLKKATQKQRM